MLNHTTPISYAAHLAGYISDPSTIRARVLDEYGRAPSLEQCRNLRAAKLAERKSIEGYILCADRYRRSFRCGHPETDENTIMCENGYDRCKTCEDKRREEARAKSEQQAALMRAKAVKAATSQQARDESALLIAAMVEKIAKSQPGNKPRLSGDTIADVAAYFKVSPDDLTGPNRSSYLVDARRVVALIMRERGLSYPQIARFLRRDHSTICDLVRTFPERAAANPEILKALAVLR